MAPFTILPHTADARVRARGRNLRELFRAAAEGLFALAGVQARSPGGDERLRIALDAPDAEALLVAWLNELIFSLTVRHFVPRRVIVSTCGPTALKAELVGERRGTAGLAREVKAATYGGLRIMKDKKGLEATVLFDL